MASAANDKEASGSNYTDSGGEDPEDERNNVMKCICNICLDNAKDAVVTMCGHLFCWLCLHQWLDTEPFEHLCPVCKSVISQDKIIPIYGPETTKQEHPKNHVPPRPSGQRDDYIPGENPNAFLNNDFNFERDSGYNWSFGIAAFPFTYLPIFNFADGDYYRHFVVDDHLQDTDKFLAKLFICTAIMFLSLLLLA